MSHIKMRLTFYPYYANIMPYYRHKKCDCCFTISRCSKLCVTLRRNLFHEKKIIFMLWEQLCRKQSQTLKIIQCPSLLISSSGSHPVVKEKLESLPRYKYKRKHSIRSTQKFYSWYKRNWLTSCKIVTISCYSYLKCICS